MAWIYVNGVGTLGIVKDVASHELPPPAWTNGRGMRCRDGKMEKIHGYGAIYDPPPIGAYTLFPVRDQTTTWWLQCGEAKVYATDDGSPHSDITRASGDYNALAGRAWTGGLFNGVMVLNNGLDVPQYWNSFDASSKLLDMPNWPSGTRVGVLRPFNSYLIGLNVLSRAVESPHMVKWSHFADPGTLPTSWDIADPTKDAGEIELSTTSGPLVDCLPYRNTNVVYKEDCTWGMQYVGGINIFRFWRLFGQFGMLARNCAVETPQGHIVLTQDDLIMHDMTAVQRLMDRKLRRWFFNQINPTYYDRSFLAYHPRDNEVWVCIPTAGHTWPSLAAIVDLSTGAIGLYDLPDISHMAYGRILTTDAGATWEDRETSGRTWAGADAAGTRWSDGGGTPNSYGFLAAQPGTPKLFHMDDASREDHNGSPPTSYAERQCIAVATRDGQVDVSRIKHINEIWPFVEAEAGTTLNVYIGLQDYVAGPVDWQGPYTFDPATQYKVDVTVARRFHGVRVECAQSKSWKLFGYGLKAVIEGEY